MKRFAILASLFAALTAPAQTTPAPPAQPAQPGQPTQPFQQPRQNSPTVAWPPPGSGGPASNNLGAAQSNRFGTFTNQFANQNQFPAGMGAGGSVEMNNVEGLILNLQANIEQALPVLSALVNVQGRAAVGGTANRGVPAAPPGSVPNQRMLPTGQPGFFGTVGNEVVGMNSETFQLLIALRSDLQRVLPVLNQLNGLPAWNTNGVSAAVPGSFSGRFLLVTNAPNQRMLMPTGR